MFTLRVHPVDDFFFTPSSLFSVSNEDMDDLWFDRFRPRVCDEKTSKQLYNMEHILTKKNEKKCKRRKYLDMMQKINNDLSMFGTMDMKENENAYELSVDLPGLQKEDIQISFEKGQLVIEGERKEEVKEDTKGTIHWSERHFGSFYRSIHLPENVNYDGIEANYDKGVLKVILPKKETVCNKKFICVN